MVVACLALSISLGGVSWAGVALPRNSVGTAQLKQDAVTSAKVRNRSLRAVDFARGELPRGPQGRAGAPGAPGAPGAVGADGLALIAYAGASGDHHGQPAYRLASPVRLG